MDFRFSNQHVCDFKPHEGKKTYKCKYEDCNIQFARRDALTKHISNVHDKKKSFKCEICLSCFSKKKHLKTHFISSHKEMELFKCDICFKSF